MKRPWMPFIALIAVWPGIASHARESPNWLEVTSLTSGAAPQLHHLDAESPYVELPNDEILWLCSGGQEIPLGCSVHFPATDGTTWTSATHEPGLPVVGRFVLGEAPLFGAVVHLVPAGLPTARLVTMPLSLNGDELVRTVETDQEGRFRLPELAPGHYQLTTTLPGGRKHVLDVFEILSAPPLAEEGTPDEEPVYDLGEIWVDPGLSLGIVVMNSSGLPLADAQVGLTQGFGPEDLAFFSATTDTDGRATVTGLRAEVPTQVRCLAEGHATQQFRFPQLPTLAECSLEPLARLSGRVVDSDGAPLASVLATLEALDATNDSSQGMGSTRRPTNEEGRFEIDNVTAGRYALLVATPGYRAQRLPVELQAGQHKQLADVTLEPAPELSGRVVDAETGEPIEGAQLRVLDPPGVGGAVTDVDGTFYLTAALEAPMLVEIIASGYARNRVSIPPTAVDEPVELTLSQGGDILVRVWNESEEAPCRGCRVQVSPRGGIHATDGAGEWRTAALAPGRYFVELPEVRNLGSMVIVQGGRNRVSAEIKAGETSIVELRTGAPEVQVDLVPAPAGPLAAATLFSVSGTRSDHHYPDEPGRYRVRHRPEAALRLFLQFGDALGSAPSGSVPVALLDAGEVPPDLVLPLPSAFVAGRLLDTEGSPFRATLHLQSLQDGRWSASAQPGADGRFELPHLPAGTYRLEAPGLMRSIELTAGQVLDLGELRLEVHR